MSDRRKQGIVNEATELILDAEAGDQDPIRVWVHIHEIPDGNWGAAGRVIMSPNCAKPQKQGRATAEA